jgi:hypothetical protein
MENVSVYRLDWVVRQKVSRYYLGDTQKVSGFLIYLGGYAESLHISVVRGESLRSIGYPVTKLISNAYSEENYG